MSFPIKASLLSGLVAVASAVNVPRQIEIDPNDLSPLDQYFLDVCLPGTSAGEPDLNAPCNALEAITVQCAFGSDALMNNTTDPTVSAPRVAPQEEQVCFCQSQWFNMMEGCIACASAHGINAGVPQITPSALTSFSSQYCAATNAPSAGVEVALLLAFANEASAAATQTATTFSDPIGSRTEVSLYFTPSVTGSNAWIVSQPAATGTSDTATTGASGMSTTTSMSVSTSNGQIVATAVTSSSSSSSSGLAAAATPFLEQLALAGAVGLVGAVAML